MQRPTALVVDEAQIIPSNLLHEIRLLANLEDGHHKLLPIVLAGQPELADVTERAAVRAAEAASGVPLRCSIVSR